MLGGEGKLPLVCCICDCDCHDGDIRTDGGGVKGLCAVFVSAVMGGDAGEYDPDVRWRFGDRSPSRDDIG